MQNLYSRLNKMELIDLEILLEMVETILFNKKINEVTLKSKFKKDNRLDK